MSLFEKPDPEGVEELRKHLNALDNAVQHHEDQIDQILDILATMEDAEAYIEENAQDLKTLRTVFAQFTDLQSSYIQKVDVLDAEVENLNKEISKLSSRLENIRDSQRDLEREIGGLRDTLDEIEARFIVDSNRQEIDLESKLNEERFEDHRSKVKNELSKLRTSLNDLSDKIEENEIEIDQS